MTTVPITAAQMGKRRPRGSGYGPTVSKPLPPPLPPESRTVGQLVAESIRLSGNRFWAALPLGAADYVHALGSICALTIVFFLSRLVLIQLLQGQSDLAIRIAAFVADFVVSPMIFLGSALLYFDQAARVVDSRSPRRRRDDADLHPAVDAHRAGRSDAQVEP